MRPRLAIGQFSFFPLPSNRPRSLFENYFGPVPFWILKWRVN